MLGGIHTSIMTINHVLLDLLSSPPELGYYSRLREEADAIFARSEDWENQASLGKLIYIDSSIRESLRRNPIQNKNVLREVIRRDSLEMPNGQKIPRGAWLSTPSIGIHYNERFYPNAQLYEPFQYIPNAAKDSAEVESATDSKKLEERDPATSKQRKNQGLSTASETYLAFGYGRHSWYASNHEYTGASLVTNIYKSWPLVGSPPVEVAPCIPRFPLRL